MFQANEAIEKKALLAGSLLVLLVLAFSAFSGNYYVLVLPFILLFAALMALNWKAAWWVFLFSVPLSQQIYLLNKSLSTSLPDEPIMWCFLLLFVLLFVSRPSILPIWFWRSPLTLIVVLQFLWLIVAVAASQEQFISLKFLAAKCWFLIAGFVFPVLIFRKKSDFRLGFFLILIPVMMTMSVIMYFHKNLGFDFTMISKAVGTIYYNRVDYATVMSMVFPLIWVAIPQTKKWNKWFRLLLILTIPFFAAAIYFTFARGAMLATFFALGIAIAIRRKLVNFVMPAFYGLIALTMVYMVQGNRYIDFRPNYERTYSHFTFADHLIATFRGEDMSSMERLYRWIASVRMSRDHPVVGVGPNAFYYYYKPYAVSSFRTYVSRNMEQSTTHNYFLFMLVEQGWPAMILYAILVMVFLAVAQKTYHRFHDRFYKYATLGVAMMFAACFINNFFSELIETHKVGILFYLAIALMVVLEQKSRIDKEKPGTIE
jgi:O-antigen ligase